MKKLHNKRGVTMAELLVVIAIIGVLSGLAFIGVAKYQRSMGQLERDGIAKEIFVAAQNHLTMAYGQGYPGVTEFGTEDTTSTDEGGSDIVGDYYFIVNGGSSSADVFDQILPFGSVDETVRTGGSYIIRYQPDTGLVLDVFYCTLSGTPTRFNHELSDTETEYETVVEHGSEDKEDKEWRRDYNDAIIGWYGGEEAAELPTLSQSLEAPTINVTNADKLYVEVTNPDANGRITDSEGNTVSVSVRLLIKGISSGAEHYINVTDFDEPIVLDDITSQTGHFCGRSFDDMTIELSNGFIPGENITVQAVAYSNSALANVAYSAAKTTNSLFAAINDAKDTAYISSFRHLENLDAHVSNLDCNDTSNKLDIATALQTTDLDWGKFVEKTMDDTNGAVYYSSAVGASYDPDTPTGYGLYYPVVTTFDEINHDEFTYDGQYHTISNVSVDHSGAAGLFGAVSDLNVSNLRLIDFSITGTTSAGALAGSMEDCTVTNVVAYHTQGNSSKKITASGSAGGLIGSMSGGSVTASAAALIVNGGTNAGGLIGTASGTITGCYAGGHTSDGQYTDYNVTATTGAAGGLVGTYTGSDTTSISCSYSTCSVSGATAGGFVGSAGGSITNCYCTGLVKIDDGRDNAFIGNGTLNNTSKDNYYYMIVNEVLTKDESGKLIAVTYKGSGSTYVTAFDMNAKTFDDFVGGHDWAKAGPYDDYLNTCYNSLYCFPSVVQLAGGALSEISSPFAAVHYGDWPSPETFFVNTRS